MILLTSYNRMLRYLSANVDNALTDSKAQKQMIVNWISTASMQIEKHLKRNLLINDYTEYFDTKSENDIQFYVRSFPVITLTSVYEDNSGLWDGSESEITDCFMNKDNNAIVLPSPPAIFGFKTIRIIYNGGMAYYGVISVFTISESVGTWTIGSFVVGSISDAVGIVKSISGTSLTVEILYGIFEALETLTEYSDELLTSIGDASAILSVILKKSLVEQYPDIVRAAEIQTRYYWKHKDDFELSSTQKDATNQRYSTGNKSSLVEEAKNLLLPYINNTL